MRTRTWCSSTFATRCPAQRRPWRNKPMTRTSILTNLTLWLALAASGASGQQVLINAGGATFPYPMYSKWFDQYHKKLPNISINYQSQGSGFGIQQVTAGTVDFGASDS